MSRPTLSLAPRAGTCTATDNPNSAAVRMRLALHDMTHKTRHDAPHQSHGRQNKKMLLSAGLSTNCRTITQQALQTGFFNTPHDTTHRLEENW